MQLLGLLNLISMNRVTKCIVMQVVVFLFLCTAGANHAFAIGKWREGEVVSPPWHSDYTYIIINNDKETRYVIMQGAKIVTTYRRNGVEYQAPLDLSSIHEGDRLLFMVEGNRIYQIKKMRN